jgi:hypothetical protein
MTVLVFLKDYLITTIGLMASLFLGVFIFGLLIQFISQLTFKTLANAFGTWGTYVVAWIGTPIHELGHAIFCLIFMHRIAEIHFFKPDETTGTIGYVYHKWNPKNPWAVIGNFFIGIGPMVLGSAVLFALFYFLIPDSSGVWGSIGDNINTLGQGAVFTDYLVVFKDSALTILSHIFTLSNLSTWQFWVFLYLSICIASNVRLSWADVKGSFSAIGCIILPFMILSLILMLAGRGGDTFTPYITPALGVIYGFLTLALILALTGFIIIYIFSAIIYRFKTHSILNPFR